VIPKEDTLILTVPLDHEQCFFFEQYITQKRYKMFLKEYLAIDSHFFAG
jgi:hypothetical protein